MADQNKEIPRVSRSGRVLKKTLKIKEMENLVITEGIDIIESKSKSTKRGAVSRRKPSSQPHLTYKCFPSDDDESWSTDISSETSTNATTISSDDSCTYSRQGVSKITPKKRYKKYPEYASTKHRTIRKPLKIPKKIPFQSNYANSVSTSRRRAPMLKEAKMECDRVADYNKKLILNELAKRLGGTCHTLPKEKKMLCRSIAFEPKLSQNFGNSSGTKYYGETDAIVASALINGTVPLVSDHNLGIAPIDVAAHLKLLGDNLTEFSAIVGNLKYVGEGVYSVLLDILLCALGPLLALTRHLPGFEELPEDVLLKMFDHIAYFLPCLRDK